MKIPMLPLAHPAYVLRVPAYSSVWDSGWDVAKMLLRGGIADVLDQVGPIETGLRMEGETALDVEATGLDAARAGLLSVSCADEVGVTQEEIVDSGGLAALRLAFLHRPLVVHSVRYENFWCEALSGGRLETSVTDTMLLAARAEPGMPMSLDALCARHLPEVSGYKVETDELTTEGVGWEQIPKDILLRRNAIDAWATLKLADILRGMLTEDELSYHAEDVAISLWFGRVAARGLVVDHDALWRLRTECEEGMEALREEAGWNLGSSRQVAEHLDSLGVRLEVSEKGNSVTDATALKLVRYLHSGGDVEKLCTAVLAYRKFGKISGTYAKGYAQRLSGDGRLRSDLMWPGTITWRPSSSKPNVLNVPKSVRHLFTAPAGHVMWQADYGQFEDRTAAVLSGDERMIADYRAGVDRHQKMADRIGADRAMGKTTNFGFNYGASAYRFQQELIKRQGIFLDLSTCNEYKRAHRVENAGYFKWRRRMIREGKDGMTIESPEGGYRWTLAQIRLAKGGRLDQAQREFVNYPIQSVSQRLCSRAALKLEQAGIDCCLTVYDSLMGYLPEGDAEEGLRLVKETMEAQCQADWWQGVPVPVDIGVGPSWGALEEVA